MLAFCLMMGTSFVTFILPFFFPPVPIQGVSVANAAGFNNKVSYVAAAITSVLVFLFLLVRLKPQKEQLPTSDLGPLSRRLIVFSIAVCGCILTGLCAIVLRSGTNFPNDSGWFIQQIWMHLHFGREPYTQIEFPYGPLLFYGPVAAFSLLSPFHVSVKVAYYCAFVLEELIGLFIVAYVIDALPMLRKWKTLLFLLCALGAVQLNLGFNYTYLRFMIAPAFLVFAHKSRGSWRVAACFFVGEISSLGVSPEMGFAFAISSVAYALYFCRTQGRKWSAAVAAPLVGTAVFFLLVNQGYLLMLKTMGAGVYNFIVEPLPHILLYLFALIWLAPLCVAKCFIERAPEAPLLAALYAFGLALLPVAFGRADPGHIFFNGLVLFLLSMVTVSRYRPTPQRVWSVALTAVILLTTVVNGRVYVSEWNTAFRYAFFHGIPGKELRIAAKTFLQTGSLEKAEHSVTLSPEDRSFDVGRLRELSADSPVFVPLELPLYFEDPLKQTDKFAPSFYYHHKDIFTAPAEERWVQEMNQYQWALLPQDSTVHFEETQERMHIAMGIELPYHQLHPPYMVGNIFNRNLADRWHRVAADGPLIIYHRN